MDLKALCKVYEWEGAKFYFVPFRRLEVDITLRGLQDIDPQMEYISKTGERIIGNEPPPAMQAEIDLARKHGHDVPKNPKWTAKRRWDMVHDTFWQCLPRIVAISFPDFDEHTSSELRMFAAYWADPGADIAERWANFKQVIGTATYNALWDGYQATMDRLAPAKPELNEASDSPNAVALDGTTNNTSPS